MKPIGFIVCSLVAAALRIPPAARDQVSLPALTDHILEGMSPPTSLLEASTGRTEDKLEDVATRSDGPTVPPPADKIRDIGSRSRVETPEDSAKAIAKIRDVAARTGQGDLQRGLQVAKRLETVNAELDKLRDIKARASSIESAEAMSLRTQDAAQTARDELARLRERLRAADTKEAVAEAIEPEVTTTPSPSAVNMVADDLLSKSLEDDAEKSLLEKQEEDNEKDQDVNAPFVWDPNASESQNVAREKTHEIIDSAPNHNDAIEKLVAAAEAEQRNLRAVVETLLAQYGEATGNLEQAAELGEKAKGHVDEAAVGTDDVNTINADAKNKLADMDTLRDGGTPPTNLELTKKGQELRDEMNAAEDKASDAEKAAKTGLDNAVHSSQLAQKAKEIEDSMMKEGEHGQDIYAQVMVYLTAAGSLIDSGMEPDATHKPRMDNVKQAADEDLARLKELLKKLPFARDETTQTGTDMEHLAKEAEALVREAECEESHQAGEEKDLAFDTDTSVHDVPHECEEEVCEEIDPCDCEEAVKQEELFAPAADPCDDILQQAAAHLGI